MGAALAAYIRYVLDARTAVVVFKDDGFGRPMRDGFLATAAQIGITASAWAMESPDRDTIATERAADGTAAPIILAMIDNDSQPLLTALRRHGVRATIFGASATASDSFADLFAKEPVARRDPGFFTDGVYAIAPSILDSANAETLAVDARYRARFGAELQWEAVQAYDSTRLAIAAVWATASRLGNADVKAFRAGVQAYLTGLDGPANAIGSLTGPLWFTPDRGRQQASRVGRFHGTRFESVLLSSVNAQLGAVGYTIAVEYVFYVFFGLCLLCIVSVLAAERLRVAGRSPAAVRTERAAQWFYLAMLIATTTAATAVGMRW
jgi:branched-chain amino acid transport system substrate-binding protein